MKKRLFKYLLYRYRSGIASPREMHLLDSWYDSLERAAANLPDDLPRRQDAALAQALKKIETWPPSMPPPRLLRWHALVSAAALLTFVFAGVYSCEAEASSCEVQASNCEVQASNCEVQASNCEVQASSCVTEASSCEAEASSCVTEASSCATVTTVYVIDTTVSATVTTVSMTEANTFASVIIDYQLITVKDC